MPVGLYRHLRCRCRCRFEGAGAGAQCFFFCVKLKKGRESHFWPFFQFFSRAKIVFHAHFFPLFWDFSRPLFFHAHFCDFFHGLKIWFHAQNFGNFHGLDLFFHGHFCAYFLINIRKRIGAPCNEQNPAPINPVYFWTKFFDIF